MKKGACDEDRYVACEHQLCQQDLLPYKINGYEQFIHGFIGAKLKDNLFPLG